MTPSDYGKFRDSLGQSSGFQSWQYRLLEFVLGNKEPHLIEVHASDKQAHALLKRELATASLYDESIRLLGRRGFDVPAECTERDWTQPYAGASRGRGRLALGVPRFDRPLGPLRARGEAGGPRVQAASNGASRT